MDIPHNKSPFDPPLQKGERGGLLSLLYAAGRLLSASFLFALLLGPCCLLS
jgi:hypothetical protein